MLKRIESIWIPDDVKKLWFISFELFKIAGVGGMGNVVYYLSKELATRGYDVTVIMPSHGRHMNGNYRSMLSLMDMGISAEGDRRGMDGKYYHYKVGFEEGKLDGFKLIMVKGLDYNTGKILDSWNIYENAMEKSSLFTKGIERLVFHYMPDNLPDLVHANDWHSVVGAVKLKQVLEDRRVVIPMVFTIHLLNKVSAPWHYPSVDWSGLEDSYHYVWMVSKHSLMKYSYVWDTLAQGSIEKFGCYEADVVSTVSYSYLTYDVYNFVGNWIENKSCVEYNGTDWNVKEAQSLSEKALSTTDRREGRLKLLSYLHNLKVIPDDYTTGNMLWNARRSLGIRDDWTFDDMGEGPLLLFTGRLSFQKGLDLLLRAMKDVVNEVHNARLIALGIPIGDYGLMQDLIDRASELRDNVRLILGRFDYNMYKVFHYISSAFVVPSRWEPFGINAIEAMAVGTPTIAYAVGGLRESVIDLRTDHENGTGMLVTPESIGDLAVAIMDSLHLAEGTETKDPSHLSRLRTVKQADVNLWEKVRNNASKRVEEKFTWGSVTNSVLDCYKKALNMAKYRATSSF
ncbi:glycogen/starch synthase [Sulfuracidifex metallicus]|uniref:glycogen/starch synthase n=1 Tax=Sulfuracidifex metallicus TaxID=47303 RepID=UPI0022757543|nr:glycogen/starch synthase [Sulfuracidifex metallicus]MCY0849635.1 glycogen/starch synthase [Sulfuracidifex metallicus]